MPTVRRPFLLALLTVTTAVGAVPLTRQHEVDFSREFTSPRLTGLALRSDGRLVAGALVDRLEGQLPGLAWSLAPLSADRWLVGTGPEGRILLATVEGATVRSTPWADLGDNQVYALHVLPDGAVLAATAPNATLFLIREGRIIARQPLDADLALAITPRGNGSVLVATGSPARLWSVDPATFASAGIHEGRSVDPSGLPARGLTLIGEVRDRSLRCLAVAPDGSILAGSAPGAQVYRFTDASKPPTVEYDGGEGEIAALAIGPDGLVYAAQTTAANGSSGDTASSPGDLASSLRAAIMTVTATAPRPPGGSRGAPPGPTRSYEGRSQLVRLAPDRFPEVVLSRPGIAFYSLVRTGDELLIGGGENGELLAFDPATRLYRTLAATSGQNLSLVAVPGTPGEWLALHANLSGLSRIRAFGPGPRQATTGTIDLGGPTTLGNLSISRISGIGADDVTVEFQASLAGDENEGWTDWLAAAPADDGFWSLADTRARRLRLRFTLPATASAADIGRALVFHRPPPRRATLQDFRIFPPGVGLLRNPDPVQQPFVPLGQFLQPQAQGSTSRDTSQTPSPNGTTNRTRDGFLGSPVVARPGAQVVLWNVHEPAGDALLYTLALRAAGGATWRDIVVETRETYAEFDVSDLPDGAYDLRLIALPATPRPEGIEPLVYVDDRLVVDNTPPEVLSAEAVGGPRLSLTIHAADAGSLLDYAEFRFNDGRVERVENPVDGLSDSRTESFTFTLPSSRIAPATEVEIIVVDAAGNASARRLRIPPAPPS